MIRPEDLRSVSRTILGLNPDPIPLFLLHRNSLLAGMDGVQPARAAMLKSRHVALLEQTQLPDGSWGRFHSRDSRRKTPFPTSEHAIHRALALGLDRDHPVLQKAVGYMERVLLRKTIWLDPPERHEGWVHTTRTITAGTLASLDPAHPLLAEEKGFWLQVLQAAFAGGKYDPLAEREAHRKLHGVTTPDKYLKLNAAHPLWILSAVGNELPRGLAAALLDWLWGQDEGIYYITAGSLTPFPDLTARRYPCWLNGLELLARFRSRGDWWNQTAEWIWSLRAPDGLWDAASSLADPAWFPLSEDWRKPSKRRIDLGVRTLLCLKSLL